MTRWTWGRRAALLGGAALVVVVSTASTVPVVFDVRQSVPVRAVPVELVSYQSCDAALSELRAAMAPYVGVYGLAGTRNFSVMEDSRAGVAVPKSAADEQAAPEHSKTNAQEAGVDEPDLVKTDGKRVVTVVDGKLRVVDVASRKLTGTLDLPAGFATHLLMRGDRALVIAGSSVMADPGFAPGSFAPEGATLTMVDLKDAPKVVGTLKLDSRYIDARQVGDVVRVVVHSGTRLPWVYPGEGRGDAESLIRNQEIAATAPIEAWLPKYELTAADGSRTAGSLVACDRIRHPEQHSATSMLSVLTFDFPGELGSGDAVSIVADGDTVYSTDKSLYIADDHHLVPNQNRMPAPPTTTAIHQFDISRPGPPRHVASGQVTGSPLNQYALSEHDGHLRVATTAFTAPGIPEQPAASQSAVTVLKRADAKLVEVGKVDGLGVGERIYSVRFVGPLGYVVTFRQTDPLYTLDLSDPAKPRKVGELKINGYSAYLHPAGDKKLIGVGQEATDEGRVQGTQVSLFDVGDAAAPTRIANHHVPGGSSEVEYDPHAFLYWPQRDLLVVPVVSYATMDKPSGQISGGVLVLRLRDNAFTSLGTVQHASGQAYDPGVRRALVVGDDLWTVSAGGVQVTRIDGLATQAWVPFA
ncbi:beta-propeller domain-containing protein [Actinosynnema sp. NPDC047251]|uniref:Beta propeller domain protein n=1 Tax=Saccharothrix espanaensis (strain ATCC 51144 / DSM 44229 / JCM 9112 / NBRC 15066 / NRRL 15764) TaxID=1179773 RepID=K0K0Y8_SACES|nr:beta-propeller domain-containing protein [Saccharothrix espanaensis]CCH33900.1 beta propeller domain protein [Saccharothrix espanaensis DSM 44229]